MELSIEEAFGAFERMSARAHDRDRRQNWVSTGLWRVEDAARALALAAVRAVQETEGNGYTHGMGRWECDFDSVRAQIEALGKKDKA